MIFFAWFCLAILIFILVILGFYLIVGAGIYNFVFSRSSKFKKKIERKPNTDFEKNFWEKYSFDNINVTSFDGLSLFGKYLSKGNNKIVILVHGYGGNFRDMAKYAQIFLDKGFDILAIDCRGHGRSEGDTVGMSWKDKDDLKSWCDFVLEKNSCYKILLFGQSMGASTVCNYAGLKECKSVVAVIEDCGFDNAYKQIFYLFGRLKIKLKIFFKIFQSYSTRKNGFNLKDVDCIKQLKKSNIPVLIIHGDKDEFVPTEMAFNIYNSLDENRREIYIAQDAGHTKCFEVNERKYRTVVYDFINKCRF